MFGKENILLIRKNKEKYLLENKCAWKEVIESINVDHRTSSSVDEEVVKKYTWFV